MGKGESITFYVNEAALKLLKMKMTQQGFKSVGQYLQALAYRDVGMTPEGKSLTDLGRAAFYAPGAASPQQPFRGPRQ